MSNDKYYPDNCPICQVEMLRRKRDIGRRCKKCSMSKTGKDWAQKRRENPSLVTQAEHDKNSREKRFKENPIKLRLSESWQQTKIRAKRNNIPFSITKEEWIAMYPNDGMCPVFKTPFVWGETFDRENSPSFDRIIPELGYIIGNVKVISWRANRIKSNSTLKELELLVSYLQGI
jgi:hypothetical protein